MSQGPTISRTAKHASFAHLLDPNRKWYNNKSIWQDHHPQWLDCFIVQHFFLSLRPFLTIILSLITSFASGYDSSIVNGFQSLPQWQSAFHYPSSQMLGLLTAIQTIGTLAGYPFTPYLCDGIGRRKTVFIGVIFMIIATGLQTAAQSVRTFIGARFLVGFGISAASEVPTTISHSRKLTVIGTASPMLITEIAYPEYRAQLTSLFMSLRYIGGIVAAWGTYGTFKMNNSWSWRLPSLLQGVPAVVQFVLVLFAPESPRWLVSQGRHNEALQILAYYHADGNEKDPLVQYQFQEIKSAIEFDRTITENRGWKALFATRGNRKRMRIILAIAFFTAWSGNGLVSHYLNRVFDQIGITKPSTQLLVNGLLQIWNLFWAVLGAITVDSLGRRFLFLASTGSMLVFFMAQTICLAQYTKYQTTAAGQAFVGFVFLFSAAYDIAFTPLVASYPIEILPFDLRAKGFNAFAFVVCVALVFNQYVNPIAFDALGWKYYVIYVCWLAFEFVFLWFFVVETKNRSLEETAALFDGPDALKRIVHESQEYRAHENTNEARV
ncbi:hypothetical protein ID866_7591 [Astraeus odoratus]|nr:hypothetical protein ID866_7591 [Astraeus odoratus]